MSIHFGSINSSQIIENEYRIEVLESIVDKKCKITEKQLKNIREEVLKKLQRKYPDIKIDLIY